MSLVVTKDFDALIDYTPYFYQSVKTKEEVDEKLAEMSQSDGYATEKLLDYLYHQIL